VCPTSSESQNGLDGDVETLRIIIMERSSALSSLKGM